MLSLAAQKRDMTIKPEALRAEGQVPAVVYGPKHEAESIVIAQSEFEKIWAQAGFSSVVSLTGLNGDIETLIYDVEVHPVTNKARHVDFYAIEKGKKVQVEVPIIFTGDAPVEKVGGAVIKVLHEIEIEAEAHNIPHDVTIDLTKLTAIGQHITAGDITLPKGVTLVTNPEEIAVSATEQATEEPAEPAAEAPAAEAKPEEKKE